MANRIVGNCYIVDSATGNDPLSWDGSLNIMSIGVWYSSTAGAIAFSGIDTTNLVVNMVHSGPRAQYSDIYQFGGVTFQTIKVPLLTAGTAFIYLG